MAKYRTQIRSIVESGYPLFDFDYPIFDEMYRPVLEKKIIDRYYFREIGLETVAQFKHFLRTRLNEIMPFYNRQYLALQVYETYDPYVNKDMTVTENRTVTSDSSRESDSNVTGESHTTGIDTATGKEVFHDTPQGSILNEDYATNITKTDGSSNNNANTTDSSEGKTTESGTVTSTDEYVQKISGFDGMKYATDVYTDVRNSIVNIDVEILDNLNDLFMNIY